MVEIDERYLDVDRYGELKVPTPLLLALVFLSRHWVLLIITLASARRSPEIVAFASGGLSWIWLLMGSPALLLLFAAFSRQQTEAGVFWRKVWSKGIWIVGLAATTNACLLGWWLWKAEFWQRWPELFLASCVLMDFAIFAGCQKSELHPSVHISAHRGRRFRLIVDAISA
jgi:energy-coupling factor transporter transmembrane protein EcfT